MRNSSLMKNCSPEQNLLAEKRGPEGPHDSTKFFNQHFFRVIVIGYLR